MQAQSFPRRVPQIADKDDNKLKETEAPSSYDANVIDVLRTHRVKID